MKTFQTSHQKGITPLSKLARLMFYVHFSAFVALSSGCGGGSGSSTDSPAASNTDTTSTSDSTNDTVSNEEGEVALMLTDAEGDFLSYTVDVASISLVKANGAEVETVPLNTRIDFAEYTDMTEFFTIRTLPAGVYTQVKFNLNYDNAEIIVQDENGEAHQATVIDTEGRAVSNYTVQVEFPESEQLVVKKGVAAKLTVDFDLDSSNNILSYNPAVVEVEPLLLATATLDDTREHRARGQLQSVDTEAGTFSVDLRPFRQTSGNFGDITLQTGDDTHYEVNGTTLEGSAGLTALAALEAGTPMIVYGVMTEPREFNAQYVLAGTSVPWVGRDTARGVVIARSGDTLTLRGSHVERANGSVTFYDNIEVTVGSGTKVTRQALSNEGIDSDSVSIGQRVVVFGDMSGETSGNFNMDATAGQVRMMMNLIKGEVVSVSPLQVDLRWINGRRISLFDFTGTGIDADSDTSPNDLEIDTSTLSLSNIAAGDLVKVRGYPAAFGTAPEDFEAQTVININTEQRAAAMSVIWKGQGSNAPFIGIDDSSMVLDLTDAFQIGKLVGVPMDMVSGAENSVIIDPLGEEGNGIYAVKVAGKPAIQIFKSFANYTDALNTQISNGNALKRMVSLGRYDQTIDTMHAVVITSRFTQ